MMYNPFAMVIERIQGLESLSREEKWQLVDELETELMAGDPTLSEPLKNDIAVELERRWQEYEAHPEAANTWQEVSQKMRSRRIRNAP